MLAKVEIPRAKHGGNKRTVDVCEVLNGLTYVLSTGCRRRAIPKDLLPRSTVNQYLCRWQDDGALDRMRHALYVLSREQVGREASPTATVIDSQHVKTTESGGTRGYDAGKKIKGRKRHVMVDTDGQALKLQAHLAAIQDRDGVGPLLRVTRASWPFVALGYADGGYAGARVADARPVRIEVIREADNQIGFAVIARRWVIKRFFTWINRNRRLTKDFEASIESVQAFLYAASSVILLRQIAR